MWSLDNVEFRQYGVQTMWSLDNFISLYVQNYEGKIVKEEK